MIGGDLMEGPMVWNTIHGLRGRRLGLLIALMLALAGCGQLATQQPPVQAPAPIKLPPL
jgi:hypothetical protein